MRSTSAILRAAQAPAPFANDAPFYQVAMYDQTVPFYLGRTTRLAAFRDELALGIDAEPAKQVPTLDAWIAEWSALGRGLRDASAGALPDAFGTGRSDARARARFAARHREPSMTLAAFAFLLAGVLLNAAAQLLLKAGTNATGVLTLTRDTWSDTLMQMATQRHFVLGAACYVLSLFVWILGLSRVPVSIAYPLLSVGYIVNAIAAHYLFGEAVTVTRWLGIGFIVVGVWLVARS